MNEDGTPKTVSPKQEKEPDFLKIDKHGDMLFMSNFMRQSKDPTHFHFFKVPMTQVENFVAVLQEMLEAPDNPSNKEMLDTHRVPPEAFAREAYQAIDETRIDWVQFEKLGVTKEMLERTNSLDRMLNWQKTPVLFPIRVEIGETVIRTDARLSLRETPEGKLNLYVHTSARNRNSTAPSWLPALPMKTNRTFFKPAMQAD
ncbi:MAG: DUF4099 domain-containing protein [Bacteroides sp.]|nr:DUF4099 domain-containing protein [Bacteroides sp.]